MLRFPAIDGEKVRLFCFDILTTNVPEQSLLFLNVFYLYCLFDFILISAGEIFTMKLIGFTVI